MSYIIEMRSINKEYPGVKAVDDVSLLVEDAEIHGLMGENGAGKSTLMNILYGLTDKDSGSIKINGRDVEIRSPKDAKELGIGMVHQHFQLMPNMTVLENIILGGTPVKKANFIDYKEAQKKIEKISKQYNFDMDINAKVYQLSVGQKQRVEIIKALYHGAKIIIMDEPTAVLTPLETEQLLNMMIELKGNGCTIIFITHKLKEIKKVADHITVMRKGIMTGHVAGNIKSQELTKLMVGRDVDLSIPRERYNPGKIILEVNDLSANDDRGLKALKSVGFKIKEGEIVGIAGVEGNGQTELIEAIAGLRKVTGGNIIFKEENITSWVVRKRREKGISHIPEDRLKTGTATNLSITDNITSIRYYQKPYTNNGVVSSVKLHDLATDLCTDFLVKVPDPSYTLRTLSGGNMQKVVFAREMENNPELMIAAQPTRGVDIGAIEFLHKQLIRLRDDNKSVLLVSAELDELLILADRILVMYEGEIVAEFNNEDASEQKIGYYMMGGGKENAE